MKIEAIKLIETELVNMYPTATPADIWMNVDCITLTSTANFYPRQGYSSIVFLESQELFRLERTSTGVYDSSIEYIDSVDIDIITINFGRKPGVITPYEV